MITLDSRIGSKPGGVHDLEAALLARSVPATTGTLAYGDLSFIGEGPGGRPVYVGVEIKALEDCLGCITSGRFAGNQLQGMKELYEVPFLIIVGTYREGPDGALQHWRAGGWTDIRLGNKVWLHSSLEHWKNTVRFNGGMIVDEADNKAKLVAKVVALYSWWRQGSEHHKGHLAMPPVTYSRVPFSRPTPEQEMAARIPGVGFDISLALMEHFGGSIRNMLGADEAVLLKVPGIGKKLAKKIKEVK